LNICRRFPACSRLCGRVPAEPALPPVSLYLLICPLESCQRWPCLPAGGTMTGSQSSTLSFRRAGEPPVSADRGIRSVPADTALPTASMTRLFDSTHAGGSLFTPPRSRGMRHGLASRAISECRPGTAYFSASGLKERRIFGLEQVELTLKFGYTLH
jgi:hypothetical protein